MKNQLRSDFDLFGLAVKNLLRRPIRSLLTIIGIAAGMTAAVALIAVSGGVQKALSSQLERLGHDLILVLPATSGQQPASDEVFQVNTSELNDVTGVLESGAVLRKTLPVASDEAQGFLVIFGLSENTFLSGDRFFQNFQLADGRMPSSITREALITQSTATSFGVKPGDSITIGQEAFIITGLLAPTGDRDLENSIFISLENLWMLQNTSSQASFAWVRTDSIEELDSVEITLRSLFAVSGQNVNVQSPGKLNDVVERILSLITAALGAMAVIAILVGCIGLANTMFMAVLERTREIGIFSALGAKQMQISKIFLFESGLLGLVGGLLGLLAGMALATSLMLLLASATGLGSATPEFTVELLILSLLIAILLGVASGLLPAMRASRLIPVEALRYE